MLPRPLLVQKLILEKGAKKAKRFVPGKKALAKAKSQSKAVSGKKARSIIDRARKFRTSPTLFRKFFQKARLKSSRNKAKRSKQRLKGRKGLLTRLRRKGKITRRAVIKAKERFKRNKPGAKKKVKKKKKNEGVVEIFEPTDPKKIKKPVRDTRKKKKSKSKSVLQALTRDITNKLRNIKKITATKL